MYRFNLSFNKPKLSNDIKAVATIGNFDGVHLGHQEIFEQVNKIALTKQLRAIVITFEPLIKEYIYQTNNLPKLKRLSLLRDKCRLIQETGLIDELIVLPANPSLINLSAHDFIKEYLHKKLNIVEMVIGSDFHFGRDRQGGVTDLINNGIATQVAKPVKCDQVTVSSSLIRSLALENKLDQVNKYLGGHNLTYSGHIVYGNQLGRKYNVPTINLNLGKICPSVWGIYTAYVYIGRVRYKAVASVGLNPTVSNDSRYKLEAHLLGVDLNLYGKIATIEFLHFLRGEVKFVDLPTLFAQIHQDIADAKAWFDKTEM